MSAPEVRLIKPMIPWTNVYGLARSVLALGTLLTLVLHDPDTLFRPLGVLIGDNVRSGMLLGWSFFGLAGGSYLELARWAAVLILTLVIVGWRPRWTAVPHWWITWSLAGSSVLIDGGEQVATVLTFLMLPLALTDSRRWHWEPYSELGGEVSIGWHARQIVGISSVWAIRLQVAAIYFEASAAKVAVQEWKNGTALYYWFNDPAFGMPDWLAPVVNPVLTHAFTVSMTTWSVIILEATLFLALAMDRRWRRLLLPVGLLFHLAIVFVHGLAIFFLSMAAALILYLWPVDEPFPVLTRWWRSWAGASSRRLGIRLLEVTDARP